MKTQALVLPRGDDAGFRQVEQLSAERADDLTTVAVIGRGEALRAEVSFTGRADEVCPVGRPSWDLAIGAITPLDDDDFRHTASPK
ncbi:hypothetical protein C0581_01665 [Candidatus Parcubacteria bacterium]|nr:MAG: hypothetical protein C0581_01665 [Candidatus Parcubacteria bacterium]